MTKIDEFGNRIGIDIFGLFDEELENRNEELKEKELQEARTEVIEANINSLEVEGSTSNTNADADVNNSSWSVPIPSHNDYISNKDVDYNIYSGLMLMSNYDSNNNKLDNTRYIYKNKFNNKELAIMCKVSESTIKRNMNKLRKAIIGDVAPLVTTENTPNGIVYKLNYSIDDRYYVTIPNDMLRYLINTSNSHMIKLYVFFKVQLANGSKQIQRDYISSSLGYKICKQNNDVISDMTKGLVAHGLIRKSERLEFFYDEVKDRQVPKTLVTYELVPDEEWRIFHKKL